MPHSTGSLELFILHFMTQAEIHHEHHRRPLQAHPDITALHSEVTETRHPHGPEAHLICDCFRAMSEVSVENAGGIDGNPERMAALRALWQRMHTARQIAEA